MKKQSVRCAIYTRKSVEDGLGQEFNSLDAQRSMCESYIQCRKEDGWAVLPTHYDDGGYSGGNMKRPALQALLSDIKSGKIDAVVVYKIDRLSRSLLDFVKLNEQWKRYQVDFVSVTQDINTASFVGRMLLNLLMTFAQYEMEMTSERIRDKIAECSRQGKFCAGMPPMGYKKDPDTHKLVIVPKEGKLVQRIFRLYLKFNSCGLVGQELNRRGITTRHWISRQDISHGGQPWNVAEIRKVLINPLYAGWIRHKSERYPGKHEALITQQMWDQVQVLLKSKSERRVQPISSHREDAVLSGLFRCGHCNCAMTPSYTVKNRKRYFYYACQRTLKFAGHRCPLCKIPAYEIEKIILYQLGLVLKTYSFLESLTAEFKEQQQSLYEKIRTECRGLNAYLRGKISDDDQAPMMQLEKKRAQKEILQNDVISVKEYVKNFDDLWNFIPANSRIALLKNLIAEIKMDTTHVRTLLHEDWNEYEQEIRSGLKSGGVAATLDRTPQGLMLVSSIQIQKLGGRTRIELNGMEYDYNRRSFLKAIALAWQGMELLESGEVASIPALAKQMNLSTSYLSNILKLGALSPKIVEQIVQGSIPGDLSLAALRNPIPLDWEEQWKALKFDSLSLQTQDS